MDKAVRAQLEVRYGETDAMGIVYYAHYLTYFEVGRTHFLRHWGADYALLEQDGLYAPCIEAHCYYLSSARYGDLLELRTWLSAVEGLRLVFRYELARVADGKPVAKGTTTHVFVNARGRPLAIQRSHPELWQRLKASLSS